MSTNKAVPEGLKNQECEKGNRKKRPPIPYVPVVDEVQEAVSKGKDFSYKIKLPDKTEFSVPIWDTGTQEAFLIHVQQAKSACKRKGLFQDYEDAIQAETKSLEQIRSLRKAFASALVAHVGCRCRQFSADNVVSADMSATCRLADITCRPF